MYSIVNKLTRRLINLINAINVPSRNDVHRFAYLRKNSPTTRAAADEWSEEFSSLIQSLVLNRISKQDLSLVFAGLVSCKNTGVTPQKSQAALVRAYENSSGLFQELLHQIICENKQEESNVIKSEIFGDIPPGILNSVVDEIELNGYSVLPFKINKELVAQLNAEALDPSYLLKGGLDSKGQKVGKINPHQPPDCVSAYADSNDLKSNKLFQRVSNDQLFVAVASHYLNAPAYAIDSTLWFSFPSAAPSSETAQLFHYDLDTLRWLKVFIYLSNVGPDNGPHEYIPASHRAEFKPYKILRKEYGRYSDDEMNRYCESGPKIICADEGTVVFADTRCFHKGNVVNAGYRLMFSPIYAASRVGYFHGST